MGASEIFILLDNYPNGRQTNDVSNENTEQINDMYETKHGPLMHGSWSTVSLVRGRRCSHVPRESLWGLCSVWLSLYTGSL